ncbi:hypothetical protein C8Q75DRAFT_771034 [Abortiporus biennis]|nr:hypothetical protein C8Q75DRAFT_771034 [Abortiporus biennis]
MELSRMDDHKLISEAFDLCRKMKEEGIAPNYETYDHLLGLLAVSNAASEAWAVFEDMLAVGILPTRETFHDLIQASRSKPLSDTWEILRLMSQYDISPNATTFEFIMERVLKGNNLEFGLQLLSEMNSHDLSPTLAIAQGIVLKACELGHPRLALDLAYAYETHSKRDLDHSVWMACLISSAENFYAEGVTTLWKKVVKDFNMLPDEGTCINVLNTAARHHLSELALDTISTLKNLRIPLQEYHYAALLESLCTDVSNLKDAFMVLSLMRSNNVEPTAETAVPLFKVVAKDTDAVDEAWDVLHAILEEGHSVDIVALNVLIAASVTLNDLQRAIGTYKAIGDFHNVKPNVETFNTLIAGCAPSKHRDLGDKLLSEMREAGIKPNSRTYERMIYLCLTQANYEDAFFYLEEMKSAGFVPPPQVYEMIIRKCVSVGDTRYKLAVEEMEERGYQMSQRLKSFIDSGGAVDYEKTERKQWVSSKSNRVAKFKKDQFAKKEEIQSS